MLNEHLLDYVRIVRQCMSETEVFIATNGTLLAKMSDKFWETLKDNNTGLMVTKYPVKLDYEALRKIAERKGVAWEYLGSSEKWQVIVAFPFRSYRQSELYGEFCSLRKCQSLSHFGAWESLYL